MGERLERGGGKAEAKGQRAKPLKRQMSQQFFLLSDGVAPAPWLRGLWVK
ncbi:hypothetical protein EIO_2457 [Ketogulonicigenium vulgare Y25]|uniref:Uncharacterized protein n=1 Tax=Ketogulonicigenium vulgare (strain WSH-001) TaxID=759362 RepID=F9Y4T5_KETVW|nr:hypothetical protein EIO_2457 [Ketogulonicigenium vulgare Y25]AEM41819.1 hypothetical protein KVU_1980 [Ketogulonicigenium vulgare WSH-001]ALJ81926.1 hypothetical protein KVH_12580 [Ketogulonicigenium vulgare]ANW35193.1 hypothetical protein KvSKV_12500 [Ketogulonicigenium vulgare]AOZ55577.1 hypothetical protein KVC_2575 [Ketogulonicigenium vulgare]